MNEKKTRKTNASERNVTGTCVRCKRQIDRDNPVGGVEEQHVGSTIQRGFVCQECERPNPADDQGPLPLPRTRSEYSASSLFITPSTVAGREVPARLRATSAAERRQQATAESRPSEFPSNQSRFAGPDSAIRETDNRKR